MACEILAPWPGTEPSTPAMEGKSFNHWLASEFPQMSILKADELWGLPWWSTG